MEGISTFEMLPDEMILQVCQYLHSPAILYSFYNLNSRLNSTIADFCYDVNLRDITYKQFTFVAKHIIPQLGHSIESFVFNGKWENILLNELNTKFYHMDLSLMFPQLHTVLLVNLMDKQLNIFLDKLSGHSRLIKLDIRNYDNDNTEGLLEKVLDANNGQLKTILFDDDSCNFVLNMDSKEDIVSYPNIETLRVNLETDITLEYIFRLVPNIKCLHINFDELSSQSKSTFTKIQSLQHLTDFQLRSMGTSWSLEDITYILSRMPSLQRLALNLYTEDLNLVTGQNFMKILPSSSLELHLYFIYDYSDSSNEVNTLSSTWSTYIQIQCLIDEPNEYAIVHTIPCDLCSIIISANVANKMASGVEYMRKVRDLKIVGEQTSKEIYSIVQHFHRLRKLVIGSKDSSNKCMVISTQPIAIRLPHLKSLYVKGLCDIFRIIHAAPNLRYLSISFDYFNSVITDTSTSELLQKRIVDLEILQFCEADASELKIIAEKFNHLTNLSISLKIQTTVVESLLLQVLSLWKNRNLRGLYIKGSLTDEVSNNFRQWLVDHTHIRQDDSFIAEYQANWISLWLQ